MKVLCHGESEDFNCLKSILIGNGCCRQTVRVEAGKAYWPAMATMDTRIPFGTNLNGMNVKRHTRRSSNGTEHNGCISERFMSLKLRGCSNVKQTSCIDVPFVTRHQELPSPTNSLLCHASKRQLHLDKHSTDQQTAATPQPCQHSCKSRMCSVKSFQC